MDRDAFLRSDDKGNRYCVVKKEVQCKRCGTSLKNKESVYLCSVSKNVYCSKCMHSSVHWCCPNPHLVNEHIDWFAELKVES